MEGKLSSSASKIWNILNRKKTVTDDFHDTQLKRCLNTFDLTLLGIGHMIGAGIYVLTGTVVKDLAGPAAVLSYVFAGVAAILSALCYAEFGARVPKAGSAYSYTYVTLGEFWGFIIGWNIVLEHLLGASSVARAWSGALDSIFNGAIKNSTLTTVGYLSRDSQWLSEYPDFIAFTSTIIVFIVVATGAKFSMHFNNIFTIMNLVVIVFLICVGFYFADVKNWTDPSTGGFFPYGFGGTWAGAATCFYAYIGFEGIAVAGEEAKNPEKSIPIATILSLSIVAVLYVLVTCSLTLMVSYLDVDPTAAFPMAFATVGAQWAKYIVGVGTLFGITTSLLGSAFSLPRCIYAMSDDGLLFRIFAYVHPKTQTPIWGIFVFGMLAALMALLFEIETLVEFMSIGTLLAYTIVAVSVVILRYLPVDKCQFKLKPEEEQAPADDAALSEDSAIMKKSKSHDDFGKLKDRLKQIPVLRSFSPGNAALTAIFGMLVAMICFCAILLHGFEYLHDGQWWAIILIIIFGALIVLCYLILIAHEKNDAFLTFQIPLVPLIPCLSMFCNITLMMKLNYLTWIRLGIWLVIGLLLYFCYGVWFSKERNQGSQYGQIVGYTGDASISCSTISKLDEQICEPQPKRTDGVTDPEGISGI
ncbi:hypothetical protein FSP39_020189 [Pinctada imbricata]|uniref:Cationic amino acid transporter C-terminal domain-containing protein n=1 Tax=Pinctada imbricata TaxID=66713 RepID=A0AA88YHJ0_PINIB|nr:hypothetical protein FSP39_020189 [Pinctada imbricata]